jgi:hypothetical protein
MSGKKDKGLDYLYVVPERNIPTGRQKGIRTSPKTNTTSTVLCSEHPSVLLMFNVIFLKVQPSHLPKRRDNHNEWSREAVYLSPHYPSPLNKIEKKISTPRRFAAWSLFGSQIAGTIIQASAIRNRMPVPTPKAPAAPIWLIKAHPKNAPRKMHEAAMSL